MVLLHCEFKTSILVTVNVPTLQRTPYDMFKAFI